MTATFVESTRDLQRAFRSFKENNRIPDNTLNLGHTTNNPPYWVFMFKTAIATSGHIVQQSCTRIIQCNRTDAKKLVYKPKPATRHGMDNWTIIVNDTDLENYKNAVLTALRMKAITRKTIASRLQSEKIDKFVEFKVSSYPIMLFATVLSTDTLMRIDDTGGRVTERPENYIEFVSIDVEQAKTLVYRKKNKRKEMRKAAEMKLDVNKNRKYDGWKHVELSRNGPRSWGEYMDQHRDPSEFLQEMLGQVQAEREEELTRQEEALVEEALRNIEREVARNGERYANGRHRMRIGIMPPMDNVARRYVSDGAVGIAQPIELEVDVHTDTPNSIRERMKRALIEARVR